MGFNDPAGQYSQEEIAEANSEAIGKNPLYKQQMSIFAFLFVVIISFVVAVLAEELLGLIWMAIAIVMTLLLYRSLDDGLSWKTYLFGLFFISSVGLIVAVAASLIYEQGILGGGLGGIILLYVIYSNKGFV
jgi:hypothetical protein